MCSNFLVGCSWTKVSASEAKVHSSTVISSQ
jgi:hypothetical protein